MRMPCIRSCCSRIGEAAPSHPIESAPARAARPALAQQHAGALSLKCECLAYTCAILDRQTSYFSLHALKRGIPRLQPAPPPHTPTHIQNEGTRVSGCGCLHALWAKGSERRELKNLAGRWRGRPDGFSLARWSGASIQTVSTCLARHIPYHVTRLTFSLPRAGIARRFTHPSATCLMAWVL